MAAANALNLNILGFPAVNRDLRVEVRDAVSQQVVRTAQPFSDGTVRIPQIAPGAYEMVLNHPNLALPVLRRPIRVLPTGDTSVSVVIDPSQFRNTPIQDIPDANLGPVRDQASSVAETVLPLSTKHPGEAIKAEDFNQMASAIRDLALAFVELTRLVSPVGHNHPELEAKFDEVTGNFQQLLNTVSTAMAELQRQIQSQRVRAQVEQVLDQAEVDKASPQGRQFLDLVDQLDARVTDPPTSFGRTARDVGVQLQTHLEQLIDQRAPANPDFADAAPVKSLSTATDLLKTQRTTSYDSELEHHLLSDRQLGGGLRLFARNGA
jgi:hypothetical protein